jgi:hypothetical protein
VHWVARLVFLCLSGGTAVWLYPAQVSLSTWLAYALAVCVLALFGWEWMFPPAPRIIAVYQKPVVSKTFLSGYALARNRHHLPELNEFGYPDPLRGETLVWHSPERGVAVMNALLDAIELEPTRVDCPVAVLGELVRLRDGLLAASRSQSAFALLVEQSRVTNALVWEIRGGYA